MCNGNVVNERLNAKRWTAGLMPGLVTKHVTLLLHPERLVQIRCSAQFTPGATPFMIMMAMHLCLFRSNSSCSCWLPNTSDFSTVSRVRCSAASCALRAASELGPASPAATIVEFLVS